jgi:hypothetical protein
MATLTLTVEVTDTEQAILLNDLLRHQRLATGCNAWQEEQLLETYAARVDYQADER